MTHRVKILQLDSTVAETVNYIQGDVRIQLRQRERTEQSFGHGSQRSQLGSAELARTAWVHGLVKGIQTVACQHGGWTHL